MTKHLRPAFAMLMLAAASAVAADPCTAPVPSPGTVVSGVVRYVGDGDGLCVGASSDPRTWIEVRLADFYAPELHEAGGEDAKRALQQLAYGRPIRCIAGRRSYDRTLATCTIDGTDLGDQLRRAGVREGGRGLPKR